MVLVINILLLKLVKLIMKIDVVNQRLLFTTTLIQSMENLYSQLLHLFLLLLFMKKLDLIVMMMMKQVILIVVLSLLRLLEEPFSSFFLYSFYVVLLVFSIGMKMTINSQRGFKKRILNKSMLKVEHSNNILLALKIPKLNSLILILTID